MLIFWKARLAFLAVPKTGTHAYEAALGDKADIVMRHPQGMKHMGARKFRRKFEPILLEARDAPLEMLAVIREPVDWLGSWYRYRARPYLDGHKNSTAGMSFDKFVEDYLKEDTPAHAAIGSQARFVSDGKGQVIVDHLFPYEDQAGLRDFLSRKLDQPVPTPPTKNASPKADLELAPELALRLRTERPADFALHDAVSALT